MQQIDVVNLVKLVISFFGKFQTANANPNNPEVLEVLDERGTKVPRTERR